MRAWPGGGTVHWAVPRAGIHRIAIAMYQNLELRMLLPLNHRAAYPMVPVVGVAI